MSHISSVLPQAPAIGMSSGLKSVISTNADLSGLSLNMTLKFGNF
jgi:hypothetical protein